LLLPKALTNFGRVNNRREAKGEIKMPMLTQGTESRIETLERLQREFEAAGNTFSPVPKQGQHISINFVPGFKGESAFTGTYLGCATIAGEPSLLLLNAIRCLVVRRSAPGLPRGTYVQVLNDPEITTLAIKGVISWKAVQP
jgi:hypothetical protein